MTTLVLGVSFAHAQAVNDSLCHATALTVGVTCTAPNGDLTGATLETDEPLAGCFSTFNPPTNSVWFTFTAPATGLVLVSANYPNLATVQGGGITMYDMKTGPCSIDSLVEIACNAGEAVGAGGEPLPSVVASLTPGKTYYLQVVGIGFGPGANEGAFCIQIDELQPPANDDVCNAIAVELDSAAITFSNVGATSIGEFSIAPPFNPSDILGLRSWGLNTFIAHSIWFTFEVPASGIVEIDLAEQSIVGNFNSKIALYTATDCNDLSTFSFIQAQDNYLGGFENSTSGFLNLHNYIPQAYCLTPGETYYLLVDGISSFFGNQTNAQGLGLLSINTVNPDPLSFGDLVFDASCAADTNGGIVALASGGATDPSTLGYSYSYLWSTGDTTPYLKNVSAGTYMITVTDACDSSYTTSFDVLNSDDPNVQVSESTQVCPGEQVELSALGSGGKPIDLPRAYLSVGSNFGPPSGRVFEFELDKGNEAVVAVGDTLPRFYSLTYANGLLYGLVSGNQLYSIDPISSTYTLIDTLEGASGMEIFRDIDFNYVTNKLVGNTDSSRIYEIDPSTAITTFVEEIPLISIFDMAIDTNGVYFFRESDASTLTTVIYSYNPQTAASDTFAFLDLANGRITDLAVDPGNNVLYLYYSRFNRGHPSADQGELYHWDAAISEFVPSTFVEEEFGIFLGLAIAPPTIEPYSYSWAPADGLSDPNVANPTATVDSTSSWVVTVMDACGIRMDTVTITVDPPVLSLMSTPDNGSSNGSAGATISGGVAPFSYAWSNGATTDSIIDIAAGIYTVTVTDALGCTSIDSVEVTSNVSIDELAQAGIGNWEIFPNPATDYVQVRADLSAAQAVNLSITTTMGQVILSKDLPTLKKVDVSLNTSNLTPGFYLLAISTSRGKAWQSFVVR